MLVVRADDCTMEMLAAWLQQQDNASWHRLAWYPIVVSTANYSQEMS